MTGKRKTQVKLMPKIDDILGLQKNVLFEEKLINSAFRWEKIYRALLSSVKSSIILSYNHH